MTPRWLWGALAALLALAALYLWAEGRGYRRALEQRQDAAQQAKEKADEISEEVDRRDDDALVDGLFRAD